MNKMTIIQLLNKIANGEEVPYKVKYYDVIYRFDFFAENSKMYVRDEIGLKVYLFEVYDNLNDEVEVMEEDKKIERLDHEDFTDNFGGELITDMKLVNKINEIIDKLNKGE